MLKPFKIASLTAIVLLMFTALDLYGQDIQTVQKLEAGDSVTSIAFSPDGGILAVATNFGAHFYNAVNLKEIDYLSPKGGMPSVAFSPDGKLLAGGIGSEVQLWDVSSRKRVETLFHTWDVFSVAFSPDGKLLACGSHWGVILLWNLSSAQSTNKTSNE